MWNSDNPLKVYLEMSKDTTDEELKKLQEVIDEDKELDGSRNNRDVCGEYAPFCEFCDKNLYYACARAYIKMKNEDNFGVVQLEHKHFAEESPAEVPQIEVVEEIEEKVCEESMKDDAEEVVNETQTIVEENLKKVIRIAHIKRVK